MKDTTFTTLTRHNGDTQLDVNNTSVGSKISLKTPGETVRVEWSEMDKEQTSQVGGEGFTFRRQPVKG